MSKTGACQRDPEEAWLQNVQVTKYLSGLCREIPFVFFSTDLVFAGDQRYYREDSATAPRMFYGETKVAAEKLVLENERHLVIRTSINFGHSPTGDRSFNEDMLAGWRRGAVLSLFDDEFRCPIAASVVADVALELLARDARGLFHVAGGERLSRFEIGLGVAEFYRRRISRGVLDLPPDLLRVVGESLKSYQGPPRCPDASMDVSKVEAFLGRAMPKFSEWITTAQ
jgi:dTDP-4-dehydrorhamnose reductase